jgi:hypothetical protein
MVFGFWNCASQTGRSIFVGAADAPPVSQLDALTKHIQADEQNEEGK